MALSASRLTSNLAADYFTQLKALFPYPPGLLPGEQTQADQSLQNLAQALANADGPDIVNEIVDNALVTVPFVTGVTPGGSNSGSGNGTVS